jgi:hypothetical protein
MPEILPAKDFKQLQTPWRSAVVVAAELSPFNPLQQAAGTAPPFWR